MNAAGYFKDIRKTHEKTTLRGFSISTHLAELLNFGFSIQTLQSLQRYEVQEKLLSLAFIIRECH